MVALSFAAAATTTLRLGMLVMGNDYRHPAVLAQDAATLDVMSDGRLEFGLGAGWMTADYEALGLPYDSHGTRIDRLAEALAVVKGAWGDGAFDLAGDHYTITAYDGLPKPLQQPRPPILVGGGGAKLLRLAGREADIVGINPILSAGVIGAEAVRNTIGDATARKIGWVREGAGERFDDLELQIRYFVASITDDARGLAEAMAPGFGVSPDEGLGSAAVLAGSVDEVCDTLVRRREEWGVSYVVFGDDQYEEFAPVVSRLAGT
jgi:probable F420-dependent oxidoreductase